MFQLACNPNDANSVVAVGTNVFRILACSDYNWKQYGYNKADQLILTTVAWISQDRVLTGTKNGTLLLIESGDLKAIFNVNDLPVMQLKVKDE